MYTLAEPISVNYTEDMMNVALDDGRIISVPLAWFPRLMHASDAQLRAVELSPAGLHWDELDEDVSIEGLLLGRSDLTRTPLRAA